MKTNKTGLSAQPGSSRQNLTGGWRSKKPLIDQNKCIGCSLCAKICPEGCIDMVSAEKSENKRPKAQTDYDYCKGCGLCAHECPVKAIKMEDDL
jgi:2-oxoacid:acceptor oxidoreductase delta subunit (pyruvate/2-ketoisovalerate family)